MPSFKRLATGFSLTALAAAGLWMSGLAPISAADHFDPPQRTDAASTSTPDIPADLADLYLYHTDNSVIVSLDFGGPRPTSEAAKYDRDVLYNILLSNAGLRTDTEFNIEFKFGQDPVKPNASGVRVTGIPGTTGPIVGPVETILTDPSGVRVFAGLIDDPFNFDAAGLRMTRETGTLMFNNQRNRFAQMNSTAIIIEIPKALIRNGDNKITAWATSARITGAR